MTTVAEAALKWHQAGISTIPIVKGGSKRPAVRWAEYQARVPELGEMDRWWGNGHDYGLAIICGHISGRLEMVELEARANTGATLLEIDAAMAAADLEDLWVALTVERYAYMEVSPSGGMHILYRISDHEVPGNTKIARRPATEEELAENPLDKMKVLAETRGEGGYVIVAPTSGICHPSGQPWTLAMGEYGEVPYITWEQREGLLQVLHDVLDQPPQTPAPPVGEPLTSPGLRSPAGGAGLTPGDDFEGSTDWAEILEPHGWTLESRHGPERNWTRPGKSRKDGASATTGYKGDRDRLYVFSTSTEFDAERPYTKFGAYALLEHRGDHSAAARELVRQGFGKQVSVFPPLSNEIDTIDKVEPVNVFFTHDEVGNSQRLWANVKGNYHWVPEAKCYYMWDGRVWDEDYAGSLQQAMIRTTDSMLRSSDDEVQKWGRRSRSERRINSACSLMRSIPGAAKRVKDFDRDARIINLGNGILNLTTGVLAPHAAEHLQTRLMNVDYDADAEAPLFTEFIETVLPDPAIRAYVQRAVGYTLVGRPNQRAIFMVHGPKHTGKSTFMDVVTRIFGGYGAIAPPSTFKSNRNGDKGPNNDLHSLRGKRFVATSETSDSAAFDEDLIKRITGNDKLTSRALYREHVEWTPECSIWLATNFPPRFNSDDDAIWDRAKLIPFTTRIQAEDVIYDLADRIVEQESSGVLNWILEGVAAYMADGLNEPEMIHEAAKAHRETTDSALRFIDDKLAEGVFLSRGQISIKDLHAMYVSWATSSKERSLSFRRFNDRLMSSGRDYVMDGRAWVGISRHPTAGLVGHLGRQMLE